MMDADEIEANKRRAHYPFTANYTFTPNGTEQQGQWDAGVMDAT